MTIQRPPDQDGSDPVPDLEYDLAHEAADQRSNSHESDRPADLVQVTRTDDYDGDYGYDLAHDVPRPARPPETWRR